MKVNVYIDAFNLYYGAIKRSSPNAPSYHWLDIFKLSQVLMPRDQIHKVKYFTALVAARPHDLQQPVRQQTYLRALETLPNVSIIPGHFLQSKVMMPLVTPIGGQKTALVYKTEEKGSDVNIATHLLHDGHLKDYELAVVISNDSDLVEPIRLLINDLHIQVGVFNPQLKSKHPSVQLQNTATFLSRFDPVTWRLVCSLIPYPTKTVLFQNPLLGEAPRPPRQRAAERTATKTVSIWTTKIPHWGDSTTYINGIAEGILVAEHIIKQSSIPLGGLGFGSHLAP